MGMVQTDLAPVLCGQANQTQNILAQRLLRSTYIGQLIHAAATTTSWLSSFPNVCYNQILCCFELFTLLVETPKNPLCNARLGSGNAHSIWVDAPRASPSIHYNIRYTQIRHRE